MSADPTAIAEVESDQTMHPAMFENAEDLSEVCEYYDGLLEEMNS